jgi:cell wall-associated NlpC family hydrolase
VAAPGVPGWQQQILGALKAPPTPQNLSALNAWQRAEGGSATNNPFNTTLGVPGATSYNSVGVRNYQTPQQGIQATIDTLTSPTYASGYQPIINALRKSNPQAFVSAISGSPWGTSGRLVGQILGQAPGSSVPPSTPPGGTLSGSSPSLVNQPPAPVLGAPNLALGVLGGLQSHNLVGGIMGALTFGRAAASAGPPVSTPVAQGRAVGVRNATTPNGTNVEIQGKATPEGLKAVQLAEHFIGTPYSWGGGGPGGPSYGVAQGANIKGFDCSSLIQYVAAKQGVTIPRTTYDQWQTGTPVPRTRLSPGDAVYFTGSDAKGGLPGHVGMYVGSGKFIEAPHTGADIRISNLAGRSDYVGARRFV